MHSDRQSEAGAGAAARQSACAVPVARRGSVCGGRGSSCRLEQQWRPAELRTGEHKAYAREHRLPAVHQLSLTHVLQVTTQLKDRGADAQRVEADIANH